MLICIGHGDILEDTAASAPIRENVQAGSAIYSDSLKSYDGLDSDYQRAIVDDALEYARSTVPTNTMENFWGLVKRQLHGTYISVWGPPFVSSSG
jgi:transposase-like protein